MTAYQTPSVSKEIQWTEQRFVAAGVCPQPLHNHCFFFFTFLFTLVFKEAHVKRLGKIHGKFLVLVCCGVDVLRVGTGTVVHYYIQEDGPREKVK